MINFRVFEICIALSLGTICSHWHSVPREVLYGLPLSWLLTAYVYYQDRTKFQTARIFPLLSFLLFFQVGYWNHQLRQPIYKSDALHTLTSLHKPDLWALKVHEVGKPNARYEKYIVRAVQKGQQPVDGLILLTINRDSITRRLNKDDELLVYGAPKKIIPSPNPYQFDFKTYMEHKGVFHSLFLQPSEIYCLQSGSPTLRGLAERLRTFLVEKLKQTPLKPQVRAITQAITLGFREDIDPFLYEAYAKAGAVHILAVSGLHVGVLMLFLNYLFSFLLELPNGRFIRTFIVVVSLWAFALLTGLSPSVVRAVSMFSLLSVGRWSDRPTQGLNSLLLSYFILLLIAPHWLFQLGFQMSYLAVASILWFQPKLQKIYQPKYGLVRKAWIVFTVSLSAQVGVAPLSIYHFQQFPGLFWLTNWVVLPFIALVLIYALIIVGIAALSWKLPLIFTIYDTLLSLMNGFIEWTAQQESFLLKTAKVPWGWVLLSYMLLLTLSLFSLSWKKKVVFTFLSFILIFGIHTTVTKFKDPEELIWFHRRGSSSFTVETSEKVIVYCEDPKKMRDYPLKNYLQSRNKPIDTLGRLPSVFRFNEDFFVVVDSSGVYPIIHGANVVLRDHAKVHLDRLIQVLKPSGIIADGSNYPSYVNRWRKSCSERKTPFYYTGDAAYRAPFFKRFP